MTAWTRSSYSAYFWNSTLVALSAVSAVTVIGAMAAYALGRRTFPGNRVVLYLIVSTIMLPPQITMIALFQVLVGYRLYDTLGGLILVYVGTQLPLTVYILESFFAAAAPGPLRRRPDGRLRRPRDLLAHRAARSRCPRSSPR